MTIVDVLALSGAMPSSVAITFDVLATANRLRGASGRTPAFAVRVKGSGARAARALVGGGAFGVDPRGSAQVVVLPGLGIATEEEMAKRLACRDAILAKNALSEAAAAGIELATSCSGAFLFAAAGILNGRRATTSWWLAPLFRRLHPEIWLDTDALLVADGQVTTAGAAMAQMDLMLSVVARHAGPRLADDCARYLLLDQRRSQSRYMALGFLAAADERVAVAERWARERLTECFTVDDVAAAVGLSPRTFARRVERATGLSPVRFLQRLRVERAIELVETTRLPIDEIARRVGYAEPSTLRRLMSRGSGGPPRLFRAGSAAQSTN